MFKFEFCLAPSEEAKWLMMATHTRLRETESRFDIYHGVNHGAVRQQNFFSVTTAARKFGLEQSYQSDQLPRDWVTKVVTSCLDIECGVKVFRTLTIFFEMAPSSARRAQIFAMVAVALLKGEWEERERTIFLNIHSKGNFNYSAMGALHMTSSVIFLHFLSWQKSMK